MVLGIDVGRGDDVGRHSHAAEEVGKGLPTYGVNLSTAGGWLDEYAHPDGLHDVHETLQF